MMGVGHFPFVATEMIDTLLTFYNINKTSDVSIENIANITKKNVAR